MKSTETNHHISAYRFIRTSCPNLFPHTQFFIGIFRVCAHVLNPSPHDMDYLMGVLFLCVGRTATDDGKA